MKTHACKARVKNVTHEGYEIFVPVAQASFVKYQRTGRKFKREKPRGGCELLVLRTLSQIVIPVFRREEGWLGHVLVFAGA